MALEQSLEDQFAAGILKRCSHGGVMFVRHTDQHGIFSMS